MTMKKIALAGILIPLLLLSACAAKAQSSGVASRNELAYTDSSVAGAPAMEAPKAADYQGGSATVSNSVEQLVIKNANLSINVLKPEETIQMIAALATKYGGFLVTSNTYKSVISETLTITQGNITIRVNAANLDAALAEIRAMTPDPKNDVTSENVSGEDVTATVVDLESQLKSYQAASAKLSQFLDEAKTTEDALNVFNQQLSINQQIEMLQGQIKYYRESARLSAINVSVTEKTTIAPVTSAGWKPLQILRDAAQALVKVLQFLVDAIIFIVIFFGPFILIAFIIIWIVWASRKKRGWTRKGLRWYRPQPTPPPFPAKK
jgi:hypothetical protein